MCRFPSKSKAMQMICEMKTLSTPLYHRKLQVLPPLFARSHHSMHHNHLLLQIMCHCIARKLMSQFKVGPSRIQHVLMFCKRNMFYYTLSCYHLENASHYEYTCLECRNQNRHHRRNKKKQMSNSTWQSHLNFFFRSCYSITKMHIMNGVHDMNCEIHHRQTLLNKKKCCA